MAFTPGEIVVDLRATSLHLTDAERLLLRSVVDRDYVDVADLGRSLGCSDDTVVDTVCRVIAKLDAFARTVTPSQGQLTSS